MENESVVERKISRRKVLVMTSAALIVPRSVLGGRGYVAPSDKLNIGCVGVGGKGRTDIREVSSENIVALCDVDDERAAETFEKFPKATRYRDFRKMLDKEKLDAITVTTADHTHAVIAMTAMRMGKHIYLQKPLTRTIYEARAVTEAARCYQVATQMGNQGHAGEGNRLICEWVWSGALGQVREAHAWTNRPKGYWPQGAHISRPPDTPAVPSTLDWDLWLGPAQKRPYHPSYVPFDWRGWWAFGCGAIGDMACHIVDTAVWSLKLGHPERVYANTSPFNDEVYPTASIVRYEFPARGEMPPVKLTWYDGGLMPHRPSLVPDGQQMGDNGGGVLLVGEKGVLVCGTYGANPILYTDPETPPDARPPEMIARSPGIYKEWIKACKGGPPTTSNFDVAGPLTEIALLGNLAIRFQDRHMPLAWNGEKMEVTNLPEANDWMKLDNECREGWSLKS